MLAEVPVIELGLDGAGRASVSDVASAVDEACQAMGFLVITDHGVDPQVLDQAFAASRDFFELPQAAKDGSHPRSAGRQRGYHGYATRGLAATLGQDAPPDMRESLFFGPFDDHRACIEALPLSEREGAASVYAPNIVPTAPALLGPAMTGLYRQFERLTVQLLRIMAMALGAPREYFADKIGRHFSVLASHYYPIPPVPARPGQLRTGTHTDFGAFTILAMREETPGSGGLEVRMPDGQWRRLSASPAQLVVNLGDMMERWTDGRWVSTLHRVAVPALQARPAPRQSIGYFMHPDYDARIETVPGLLARGESPAYAPMTAGEHIRAKIARSHGEV